jgi:hypothetical protein
LERDPNHRPDPEPVAVLAGALPSPLLKTGGNPAESRTMVKRRSRVIRDSAAPFRLLTGVATLLALLSTSAASALLITEVRFDPVAFGSDAGQEFVEIYNDEGFGIDLSGYSLGWGGADYTFGTHDLDAYGVIDPGMVIVIGGPSDGTGFDFAPELANGFLVAAGVALFDVDAGSIASATPVDALIYGTVFVLGNPSLIDDTGGVGAVDVVTASSTENAVRAANGVWTTTTTPTPGATPVPEPGTALLIGLGLGLMSRGKRRGSEA